MNPDDAGIVRVLGRRITWEDSAGHSWAVDLDRVRVIAEWIDDDGISIDPEAHRLGFVTDGGVAHDFYVGAAGVAFALGDLAVLLPEFKCDLELFGTNRASRVLWPAALRGRPLFTFKRVHPKQWWKRIASLFGEYLEQTLSNEVVEYLASEGNRRSTR